MKTFGVILVLMILPMLTFAQPLKENPTIALMDVTSASYDSAKARLLTDVLRSELFKTGLFRIKERGVIQKAIDDQKLSAGWGDSQLLSLGKVIAVEKIMIGNLEKFGDTIAINLRMIDVETALIDYTENVFIKNENLLFDALKELVTKIEVRYSSKKSLDLESPQARSDWLVSNWTLLGASGETRDWLVQNRESPEDYLTLRQYDISFTPDAYVQSRRSGVDMDILRGFLQAGIGFPSVQKALKLGITKLDKYRQTFQPAGLSFDDYLIAYEQRITSVKEYKRYLATFDRDFFLAGAGGVANDFPIANADFKFVLGQLGWEHFWTSNLKNTTRVSSEAGVFLLNVLAPTPYFDLNVSVGSAPFFATLGLGGHAEFLIGGHAGAHIRLGMEILNRFQVAVMVVPFGTQPKLSYIDLKTKVDANGNGGIRFPYAGVMFTYKFTMNDF